MTFPFMPIISASIPNSTAVLTYRGSTSSTSNSFTYTFTNFNIGTAAANRLVIIGASINAGPTSSYRISAITINGVSATKAASSAADKNCWLVYAPVPTGTTATIVVTLTGSGTPGRCAIGVYTLVGQSSNTPFNTESELSDPRTVESSISYYEGSVAVAAYYASTSTGFTATGLTENADLNVEDSRHGFASAGFSSSILDYTVTNTGSALYLASASWR